MADTDAPVLVADDLSLLYPARAGRPEVRAVDGISLQLAPGEILGVLGEAGSGKSTLARAFAGLAYASRPPAGSATIAGGELFVLGERIKTISKRHRDRLTGAVGYLSQSDGDNLNPDLTVGEAVAEPLYERDKKFDRKEAGRLVSTLVDAVHLPLSTMLKQTWELSSGQRQRIALARSLVLSPSVLIADEPARGVDVLVRQSVLELLRGIHETRQFSAVVVTSSVNEARAVADRIAVLRSGHLVGLGTIDDVLATTVDPYVKVLSQTSPIDIIPSSDRTPKKHR
ncbi:MULTISPECIES: ATP-binding cassette domain-containing protein [unclassified Frondihabitans]|uniref:ATP-binding cassette domain-containing protein n=1 Tax=unclassified Frondihabitans TaxID=2626248 RepID=UPI000F4F626A|nr:MULTISPECIES: ATP-binding cassette domain-containing protein [unclassified Frondihabitans]RPE75263.1 ABC-type dipeptide/oligopeptide/nickel transport system ATPase component [Frondihabitans sp. PhB153]RPF04505.1 ABC-type dipeptide/oligopeptide/nickel transport system ATPase component [Frondihabitans sp. PhB161]